MLKTVLLILTFPVILFAYSGLVKYLIGEPNPDIVNKPDEDADG